MLKVFPAAPVEPGPIWNVRVLRRLCALGKAKLGGIGLLLRKLG
jgi:hypothetical protein